MSRRVGESNHQPSAWPRAGVASTSNHSATPPGHGVARFSPAFEWSRKDGGGSLYRFSDGRSGTETEQKRMGTGREAELGAVMSELKKTGWTCNRGQPIGMLLNRTKLNRTELSKIQWD